MNANHLEIGPRHAGGSVYWLRAFPRDQWTVTADGAVIYGPTTDHDAAQRELNALTNHQQGYQVRVTVDASGARIASDSLGIGIYGTLREAKQAGRRAVIPGRRGPDCILIVDYPSGRGIGTLATIDA